MALPKQVQNQAAAAEEYDRQVKEAQAATAPEPPEPPKAETPSEPPAPPQPAPASVKDDEPTWKQRFLSLQGMFNSQVPLLQQQVKELQAQLKAKEASPPEPQKPSKKELVTKADEDAFGSDLIDVIRRGAREEIERLSEQYEMKIGELKQQLQEARQSVSEVAEVQTKSVQEQFFTTLEARLPKWEEIQASAECQNWLGSRVPGSTYTWNDALVSAANRHDVDAVMEVFDEFFSRHPQLKPGAKPAPAPAPRNREELNRQVTPAKSNAAAPTPNGSKRIFTSQDYHNESMRVIRLTQQNRRQEAEALEAELNAALAEGRVKP